MKEIACNQKKKKEKEIEGSSGPAQYVKRLKVNFIIRLFGIKKKKHNPY